MASGRPVVISERGIAVRPVLNNAPLMTVAANGFGEAITISALGQPMIVDGLPEMLWIDADVWDDNDIWIG